ncbi:hypothetical protein Tco_0943026 [Tanacetum coccineum]
MSALRRSDKENMQVGPYGSEVQVKMEMEIPRSNGVNFITACSYSTDTSKDIMKVQVYVSKLPQQVSKLKELQEQTIIKLSRSRKV